MGGWGMERAQCHGLLTNSAKLIDCLCAVCVFRSGKNNGLHSDHSDQT